MNNREIDADISNTTLHCTTVFTRDSYSMTIEGDVECLEKKTLLVIGAGAGDDVSMPMGGALATTISKYLNLSPENNWGWTDGETSSDTGNSITRAAMQILAQQTGSDVNAYFVASRQISQGLLGWSSSIDGYLNRHQDQPLVQQCGKLAIAQIILECESGCALHVNPDAAPNELEFRNTKAVRESWFQTLWSILETDIVRSKNLAEIFDRLSVITFNYDRTLEHFLYVGLQQAFHLSPSDAALLVNGKLDIDHVYGKVADLPWQADGRGHLFGRKPSPHDLAVLWKRITTFNEEISDKQLLDRLAIKVGNAQRIIFLGCHFHGQNMKLLRAAATALVERQVVIYATATGRSESALEQIRGQIKETIAARGLDVRIQGWDCRNIFREFDTTWAHT